MPRPLSGACPDRTPATPFPASRCLDGAWPPRRSCARGLRPAKQPSGAPTHTLAITRTSCASRESRGSDLCANPHAFRDFASTFAESTIVNCPIPGQRVAGHPDSRRPNKPLGTVTTPGNTRFFRVSVAMAEEPSMQTCGPSRASSSVLTPLRDEQTVTILH